MTLPDPTDLRPERPRRGGSPRMLTRGDLRLLVLALIGEQPRHGYELIQHIAALFAQVYTPSAGTMYPLLANFEQAGWITAEEDEGRRRFRITEAGQAELHAQHTQVRAAQRRAMDRVREITKAALPLELRDALRDFKRALVLHHGRWRDGEAEVVAAQLARVTDLLNGQLPADPLPTTQPD
ncbi:MAG: Transcriptional regulator YqjI [Stenotrophomonas maltophilia]|uniref:Transcriptional regulator YqjI n=1 Tax=Stenotrophomonas maltophilia TaxID=40324 RepID=A0A7V8JKW5_STEMA|nr:MAG: Transcriptional regulator YqjI [Stenotrophomonas maltophilia]